MEILDVFNEEPNLDHKEIKGKGNGKPSKKKTNDTINICIFLNSWILGKLCQLICNRVNGVTTCYIM